MMQDTQRLLTISKATGAQQQHFALCFDRAFDASWARMIAPRQSIPGPLAPTGSRGRGYQTKSHFERVSLINIKSEDVAIVARRESSKPHIRRALRHPLNKLPQMHSIAACWHPVGGFPPHTIGPAGK